jgi:hypothetical protein
VIIRSKSVAIPKHFDCTPGSRAVALYATLAGDLKVVSEGKSVGPIDLKVVSERKSADPRRNICRSLDILDPLKAGDENRK